eukprot:310917-Rhodomonas_salina.1
MPVLSRSSSLVARVLSKLGTAVRHKKYDSLNLMLAGNGLHFGRPGQAFRGRAIIKNLNFLRLATPSGKTAVS